MYLLLLPKAQFLTYDNDTRNGLDIDLAQNLNDSTDEEMLKDRELIADFMSHT